MDPSAPPLKRTMPWDRIFRAIPDEFDCWKRELAGPGTLSRTWAAQSGAARRELAARRAPCS